ncbi:MAG: tetratricopeptide repeat protein [Acidobacteria bacterium]|nr:tetratricopeptide repeat protein [Acidobacteriota bacterium]
MGAFPSDFRAAARWLLPLAGVTLLAQAPPTTEDPRTLLLQARALQRRGGGDDPRAALAIYRRLLDLAPGSAEAQLRYSEALVESGDLEGAVAAAKQAAALAPANAEAWAHLALLQHRRLQTHPEIQPEAKSALEKAAALLPQEVEVWARLGEVAEQAKDQEQALRAWLKVGRLRPQIGFAWEKAAYFAHTLGRYEAKREAVLALCGGKSPERRHLEWLQELAREQLQAGYVGHAEDSFRLLARHFPQEPSVWENMALVQLNTSRFEEALSSLREAERLRPSPRIGLNIAFSCLNLGRLPEAEARLRTLFTEIPEGQDHDKIRSDARFLLASSLLLQARPKDLIHLLATLPGVEETAELLALRAQARIQTQDWKGARGDLRAGMAKFPRNTFFQQAQAIPRDLFEEGLIWKKDSRRALQQLDLEAMAAQWSEFRRWDRCLAVVDEALRASPLRTVGLMLMQANALDQLDRGQEAIGVLRQALRLDPRHPTVQNNLGYLLLEGGRELDEAERLIAASMAQEPGNGSVVDSWGWLLFKRGRYAEAEAALRKAAELSPYSPETRKHLGEVLLKLGRAAEAADQWERAMAYSFPDRKELGRRLQDLRGKLARSEALAGPGRKDEPDPPAPEDEDEP